MVQNILSFLETSAKAQPQKTAFADEQNKITFEELQSKAQKIGSYLAERNRPRQPIPVMAEKSAAVVAVFMGIAAAGCFYIYLDPVQPKARLQRILDTLQADTLITDIEFPFSGETISMQLLEGLGTDTVNEWLLRSRREKALDTDPLYGIFTSGSTGTPKGVIVSHRSVIDFISHFTDLFGITDQDIIGNQAPFDFDVSVKDIYATLRTGATMEIIPKKLFSIPTGLLDYLCERKITTAIWAVSALCMVSTLKGFTYRVPETLNKVLFSGEVMPVKHLNIWRQNLPDALFVNLYGPTEITCNCTYYVVNREFEPGSRIPIGIPFPNHGVFLLDEEDKLVEEEGVMGEICVSGTALALGYYRNPVKTEEAFVQNPLQKDYPERIYRTGDLAHYGSDRLLYYDTRKDFQIKHMGHRIELGEIEAALETVQGVERAVCLFSETKNKIVACYVGEVDKKEIAAGLQKELPSYMFPNIYRKLPCLPVTKNGKIDRQQLKEEL